MLGYDHLSAGALGCTWVYFWGAVIQVILYVTRCQIGKEWLALMLLRPPHVHLDGRMLRTVTDMIAVT